jgi:hypothetical protein
VWIIISEKTGPAGKKKAKSFVKLSYFGRKSAGETPSPASPLLLHHFWVHGGSKKTPAVPRRVPKWSAQGWLTISRAQRRKFSSRSQEKCCPIFAAGQAITERSRVCGPIAKSAPQLKFIAWRSTFSTRIHALSFAATQMQVRTPGLQQKLADRKCSSASHLFCTMTIPRYCHRARDCPCVHVARPTAISEGHVPQTCSARSRVGVLARLANVAAVTTSQNCRTSNDVAVDKSRYVRLNHSIRDK